MAQYFVKLGRGWVRISTSMHSRPLAGRTRGEASFGNILACCGGGRNLASSEVPARVHSASRCHGCHVSYYIVAASISSSSAESVFPRRLPAPQGWGARPEVPLGGDGTEVGGHFM